VGEPEGEDAVVFDGIEAALSKKAQLKRNHKKRGERRKENKK